MYCNYSKDKFGNELTFIIPSWLDESDLGWSNDFREKLCIDTSGIDFCLALKACETLYLKLLASGQTPQQARQVLPNALKTELVMTGFVSDWDHFFDLRARGTTGKPHPDAQALAEPLMNEFYEKNILK